MPRLSMKTRMQPEAMPGAAWGMTTSFITESGEPPRSKAASIKLSSSVSRVVVIGTIINNIEAYTSPIMIAVLLYKSSRLTEAKPISFRK